MIVQPFAHLQSPVHRLDARLRVVCAFLFSVLIAVSTRTPVQAAAVLLGVLLMAAARLPLRACLKRLALVNTFVLLLWLVLPLTHPGRALVRLGPLVASEEGVRLALAVTLKCNGIVMVLTALVATVDLVELGHALHHLRLPEKLVHLLLFTVRYFDVLAQQYRRLRNAAKVRCFRPRTSWRTYRTYAHMFGMLLVASIDRSERIMAAMKCRGFRGQFYLLDHFRLEARDVWFGAFWLPMLVLLGVVEWLPMGL